MMGSELKASFGSTDSSQCDQCRILHQPYTAYQLRRGQRGAAAPPPLTPTWPRVPRRRRAGGAARRPRARRPGPARVAATQVGEASSLVNIL